MRVFAQPERSRRSGGLGILVAIVVLLAAGGWAVWRGQPGSDPSMSIESGRPLLHDFAEAWSWSEDAFFGGAKQAAWSFRWDGRWKPEQARSLAERLGISLSLRQGDLQGSDALANAYTGAKDSGRGYAVTFWMLPGAGQDKLSDAVILLQAAEGVNEDAIAGAADEIEQVASELGLQMDYSFSVRGKPANDDASARIVRSADAKRLEVYDDGNTSSMTYYTPKLESRTDSGGRQVNLQIAETRPGAGADAELVIGVPLITGDYGIQRD